VSKNTRIDYSHFAGKYSYATGADGSLWTRAELKILLDEINRMYDKEDLCAEHCKKLWSQLKKRDEEIDVLRRKIKLLDVLNDTDNALDKEILSSDILRENELEGLYDEATLKEYDYYD
jgi:hypothetical protein